MPLLALIKKLFGIRYYFLQLWEKAISRLRYPSAYLWRFFLFRTTIIAISGSTGKTTTKELLATILSSKFPTVKTSGTWNSYKFGGVAGTILSVRPWHRYAVIETAVGAPGDMKHLVKLLRPDIAIMLGVKLCHTNTFKTLENIAREKSELVRSLGTGKLAVLNGDDYNVLAMRSTGTFNSCIFGTLGEAEFRASDWTSQWPGRLEFQLHYGGKCHKIKTNLVGIHWVDSILAALATGVYCGVPIEEGIRAIESVKPFWARMQPVTLPNGATVIRDEWNGSKTTFEVAYSVMEQASSARKFVVVSDFSDSSLSSRDRGKRLGREAARVADWAVFVGGRSQYSKRAAIQAGMCSDQVRAFYTIAEASSFLRDELRSGDLVMLKGRTSDHLSRIFLAQLDHVTCTLDTCRRQILCDRCKQLGFQWESKFEGLMAPPDIFV